MRLQRGSTGWFGGSCTGLWISEHMERKARGVKQEFKKKGKQKREVVASLNALNRFEPI